MLLYLLADCRRLPDLRTNKQIKFFGKIAFSRGFKSLITALGDCTISKFVRLSCGVSAAAGPYFDENDVSKVTIC